MRLRKNRISLTAYKYFFSYMLILCVLLTGFFYVMKKQFTLNYFERISGQNEAELKSYVSNFREDVIYLSQIDKSIKNNVDIISSRYNGVHGEIQIFKELCQYDDVSQPVSSIIYRYDNEEILLTSNTAVACEGNVFIFEPYNAKQTIRWDITPYLGSNTSQLISVSNGKNQEFIYLPPTAVDADYIILYLLDIKSIYQELKEMISEKVYAVALLDAQMNPIIGENEELLGAYLAEIDGVSDVIECADKSRLYLGEVVADQIYAVSLLSRPEFEQQISGLFEFPYQVFFMLGLAGLAALIVSMRMTYYPLRELTKKIVPDSEESCGYIEQLEDVFLSTEKERQELKSKVESYRIFMQKSILEHVVSDVGLSLDNVFENIDEMFDTTVKKLFFVLYAKAAGEAICAAKVDAYFEDIPDAKFFCLTSDEQSGTFLIDYRGNEPEIRTLFMERLRQLNQTYGYFVAMSQHAASPLDIPLLYENAVTASNYWNLNPVQDFSELVQEDASQQDYPYEKLNELFETLTAHNSARVKQLLNEFFALLDMAVDSPDRMPDFYIRCILIDILTGIVNAMNQSGIKFNSYSNAYYELIFLCRSAVYDTEKENIKKKIMAMIDMYEEMSNADSVNPIELRRLVQEHFCDPDFSITMLADYFKVSVSHMSYVAKKELGENLSDYISELRMQKAQMLLANTQMSIDEISVEVGYVNTASFRRRFKQKIGYLPSQYREAQYELADMPENLGGGTKKPQK